MGHDGQRKGLMEDLLLEMMKEKKKSPLMLKETAAIITSLAGILKTPTCAP